MRSSTRYVTVCNCFISVLMLLTIVLYVFNIGASYLVGLVLLCMCSIPWAAIFEIAGVVFSCILLKREKEYKYLIINLITFIIVGAISAYIIGSISFGGDGI